MDKKVKVLERTKKKRERGREGEWKDGAFVSPSSALSNIPLLSLSHTNMSTASGNQHAGEHGDDCLTAPEGARGTRETDEEEVEVPKGRTLYLLKVTRERNALWGHTLRNVDHDVKTELMLFSTKQGAADRAYEMMKDAYKEHEDSYEDEDWTECDWWKLLPDKNEDGNYTVIPSSSDDGSFCSKVVEVVPFVENGDGATLISDWHYFDWEEASRR